MNLISKKIKFIYIPFILTIILSVGLLTLAHWLLSIKFHIIDIKVEIWNLWIPFIFPWIPIILFLRFRYRIFKFDVNEDGKQHLLQLFTWIIMLSLLSLSQNLIVTYTSIFKEYKFVNEIDVHEDVTYFKINNYYIKPNFGGTHIDYSYSGKYNQNTIVKIFLVSPIFNDSTSINSSVPTVWYGRIYKSDFKTSLNPEKKAELVEHFYRTTIDNMKNISFYDHKYFKKTPNSSDKDNYLLAIDNILKGQPALNTIILEPRHEVPNLSNPNSLKWFISIFLIGNFIMLIVLYYAKVNEKEIKRIILRKKPKQDDLLDAIKYLIPKGSHFASSIIIIINILVFLIMTFSGVNFIQPKSHDLHLWGANNRHDVLNGEWWRLFTSIIVHGGILHLFYNTVSLVIASIFIEPKLGRKKYVLIYIFSGLFSSLTSIWWHENSQSVGASGAIFGLFGAIIGYTFTSKKHSNDKGNVLLFIGFLIVPTLLVGLIGNFDNAAHIGGLISGAIIAIIFNLFEKYSKYFNHKM